MWVFVSVSAYLKKIRIFSPPSCGFDLLEMGSDYWFGRNTSKQRLLHDDFYV